MIIIGVDFHREFQQMASVDTDTGEFQEKRLGHREEAEAFYRALAGQKVRVGMSISLTENRPTLSISKIAILQRPAHCTNPIDGFETLPYIDANGSLEENDPLLIKDDLLVSLDNDRTK
jgi:hypothetical protein